MILPIGGKFAVKVKYLVIILLVLLLAGCSNKNTKREIEFTFDNNDKYTGFDNVKKTSVSKAKVSGYYVCENGYIVSGEVKWDEFVKLSKDNTETQIRMVNIIKDKDYFEIIDFFYRDGLYFAFSSNKSDDFKVGYEYLHVLEEPSESNLKMFFIALSNDDNWSYNKVMKDLLSSQANDTRKIILVWGIK